MNRAGPDILRTQVAVIGSGPGGSVTAALCAEAGYATLLVEEGPDLPLAAVEHFSSEEILCKYRNAGLSMAIGNPPITYVEGRCVGGGSEVNRGLYRRTPPDVLDEWARSHRVDALTADELAPHFEACEARVGIADLPGAAPPLSQRLADGATKLGWNPTTAPRLYDYTRDRKNSMSTTFIPRFREAGGQLVSNLRALHIDRRHGCWHVAARRRNADGRIEPVTIVADTLFVACGAVQTPTLLRRSGFRDNIGNSLRFHPMLKAVALFDSCVNRPGDPDPVHQIKKFEPDFGIGCSISSPALLALALAANPLMRAHLAEDAARMGLYYVQNGTGHGRVRAMPGSQDPVVLVRHERQELDRLYEGLKHLIRALFAAGAKAVQPCLPNFPPLRSVDDISAMPGRLPRKSAMLTSVHVFASCPMGEDRRLCATDSWGQVRDCKGLYIADASLMCGPTIANPQASVMAIAHRNTLRAIERKFA
jgi:choline dehydrogenase-like flavoprotein